MKKMIALALTLILLNGMSAFAEEVTVDYVSNLPDSTFGQTSREITNVGYNMVEEKEVTWVAAYGGSGQVIGRYSTEYSVDLFQIYSYGGIGYMSAKPKIGTDATLTSLKSGGVTLGNNAQETKSEMRYLVNASRTSYIAFGLDCADATPYYTLDGKTVIKPTSWPYGIDNKASGDVTYAFTVKGTEIEFTITANQASWTDSFMVDDIASRVQNTSYIQEFCAGGLYDVSYNMIDPRVSYSYQTMEPPAFVENFDHYTAENAKIGTESRATYVSGDMNVAESHGTKAELSRFIYGEDTVANTNHCGAASLVSDEEGGYKLALYGSPTYAGVNLYTEPGVYHLQKLQFQFSGRINAYNGVRFLVSDDEKSAYEIGVGKDGKLYLVKFEDLWAETNLYSFGYKEGSLIQSAYAVQWDFSEGENYNAQPLHYFDVTIEPNDKGFAYNVKENGVSVWQGIYTDISGDRLRPDWDNPVLQLVTSESNANVYCTLDDVKIWYTPVINPAAIAKDGKVEVSLSLQQMNLDSVAAVVVQYDGNGGVLSAAVQNINDKTVEKNTLFFDKIEGAVFAKVTLWRGTHMDVKAIEHEPITVIF